jgi:hypothetical protein
MTHHKPSADHPWKRDRYQTAPFVRTKTRGDIERDKVVLSEIRSAILVDKMPLLPSPLETTQFGDRDMVVLNGEGCRQKKAMRYG